MFNARHYDGTDIDGYVDTTPKKFPVRVTVKAHMLLVFRNRIHTRDNPAAVNGDTITLVGRLYGRYVFQTADGYAGDCTADAFEVK